MTDHRGPELARGSPEYAWVASIIKAVERRLGVSSRWNGRLYEETDPRFVGAAGVDGCMTVSEADVLAPARLAYTDPHLSGQDAIRARDAVATVTHEAVHLCSRPGDRSAPDAHPTRDPPSEALDEGLAEIWTHRNLSSIIRDVDMDRFAPAVIGQQTLDAYPACTAAANGLVDGAASLTGRPRADITRQLITTELAQRWNCLADMAMADEMPADDRQRMRRELANTLRADFARIQEIQASPDLDDSEKVRRAWHAGHQAATNLDLTTACVGHGRRAVPHGRDGEIAHLQAMLGGQASARYALRAAPTVPTQPPAAPIASHNPTHPTIAAREAD